MSFPVVAADGLAKALHLIEDLVDIGDNIFPVDMNNRIAWSAQGSVKNSAIFGDVDRFSGEHSFDGSAEVGLVSEVEEESENCIVDTMFGVIQVDSFGVSGESFTACWILCEEISQVQFLNALEFCLELGPSGQAGQGWLGA